ncbi:TIR domain-containing protein [Streptomyces sp. SD15]
MVMDRINLAVALVGLIATVASTYFGYLGVRHVIRRRRTDDPVAQPADHRPAGQDTYDVFVSYADAEADAARRLAEGLRAADTSVFLVRWVEPGLLPLLETERALTGAALGVLLFGRGAMAEPRIRDEYAAILERAYEGDFRFVPAQIERAEQVGLPRFAAIRRPVDLSEPGTARYDEEIARLAAIAHRRPPDDGRPR